MQKGFCIGDRNGLHKKTLIIMHPAHAHVPITQSPMNNLDYEPKTHVHHNKLHITLVVLLHCSVT